MNKPYRTYLSEEKQLALVERYLQWDSIPSIASDFDINPRTVRRILDYRKIPLRCQEIFLQEPSDIECAYAAGLFDGEGSLHIQRQYPSVRVSGNRAVQLYLRVSIANTHEGVLHWMHDHFGGRVVSVRPVEGRNPIYHWVIMCHKAARFLRTVYPYLVIKQLQAYLCIEFQDTLERANNSPLKPEQEQWREERRILVSSLKQRLDNTTK